MLTLGESEKGADLIAHTIFKHLTLPIAWVTGPLWVAVFMAWAAYQTGEMPLFYTGALTGLIGIALVAAHVTQYRVGRSLEMTGEQ